MSETPTADEVAHAIIAASRAVEADPIKVATGVFRFVVPADWRVSRARVYAALALHAAFPHCSKTAIARMVGVTNPGTQSSYVALWKGRRTAWYDPAITLKVKASIPALPVPQFLPQRLTEIVTGHDSTAVLGSDVTAVLMGDPPYERSALATAKPWKPYQRSGNPDEND